MKVFYYDSETGENIPSSQPVEMDYPRVYRLLARLVRAGSFLGVVLDERRVLQIYQEKSGDTNLEILHQEKMEILSVMVNAPIAEVAIKAVYAEKDIVKELGIFPLEWSRSTLRGSK